MKEPSARTKLLGHPIVAMPMSGFTLLMMYQWTQSSDAAAGGILMLFLMAPIVQASDAMARYKAWKRAWDAMDDTPVRPHRGGRWLGIPAVIVATLYALAHYDEPWLHALLIATAAVLLAALALRALYRWNRSRRAPAVAAPTPVTLCVTAPPLPVPSLAAAYAALPPHCRRLLSI